MRRRAFGFLGILVLAGCSVVLGLDPPGYDEPAPSSDSGPEAEAPDAAEPNLPGRLDDPTRWSTYAGNGGSYLAGPFDGRFVYFLRAADFDGPDAGLTGSRILRYDTTAATFDEPSAWLAFDPETAIGGTAGPHLAAIMDGPWLVVAGYQDGVFLRYDTRLNPNDFSFGSSWQTFNATTLNAGAVNYNTALPLNGGGTVYTNSTALVPLTHKDESFDAGWTVGTPDAAAFECAATAEGACIGTQTYLGPSASAATACLARWDQTKPIGAETSWEAFDVAALGEEFAYVHGTIATAQHLYFTQYNTKDASAPVKLLRRPHTGALDAGWESQPTNVKNPLTRGFIGGAYDGRFLYLAPYPVGTQNTIFTRFDTQGGLADPASWDIVVGAALAIPSTRYWGAVFDGQYVYYPAYAALGAEQQPTFVRFKAYDQKIPVPPAGCR
ncbi:MAG: hypothetical protein KIT84_36205 [Labilithrix sp.]|nr:hypothetical protein [Labilithrix sp.]MCW5816498.1 hypothetical protein [Labilithrix sp.]